MQHPDLSLPFPILTWGMYPTLDPGTPVLRSPGTPPSTLTTARPSPPLTPRRPTIADSTVVLPLPLAPSSP